MSNDTERKPLLSDKDIERMSGDPINAQVISKYAFGECIGRARGLVMARDYYERLITEGKLRVVDDVEYHTLPDGVKCQCAECTYISRMNEGRHFIHCPGCGNKIKHA